MDNLTKDRLRSAIVGLAIGDALLLTRILLRN